MSYSSGKHLVESFNIFQEDNRITASDNWNTSPPQPFSHKNWGLENRGGWILVKKTVFAKSRFVLTKTLWTCLKFCQRVSSGKDKLKKFFKRVWFWHSLLKMFWSFIQNLLQVYQKQKSVFKSSKLTSSFDPKLNFDFSEGPAKNKIKSVIHTVN